METHYIGVGILMVGACRCSANHGHQLMTKGDDHHPPLPPRRSRGRPPVNAHVKLSPKREYARKHASPRDTDASYRRRREANNLAVRRTRTKKKQEEDMYRQLVDVLRRQVMCLQQEVHDMKVKYHVHTQRIDCVDTQLRQLKQKRC